MTIYRFATQPGGKLLHLLTCSVVKTHPQVDQSETYIAAGPMRATSEAVTYVSVNFTDSRRACKACVVPIIAAEAGRDGITDVE